MTDATDLLFWFEDGPSRQIHVGARSMDDAKQQMARRGLTYRTCGQVTGPGDGSPGGVWYNITELTEPE